jgi:Txe/YoeB family toxin of Txe-Axe toxin-antitoxin module
MEKNLNEEISRIKSIINFMNENELPKNSGDLIRMLPEKLKELFFNQWKAKQNPKWHPEGNTLKHILVVIKRAYHYYPDDPNMIMAALFHDLGKIDTYNINPKTGEPTAYGHENKSVQYVEEFKDWIQSFERTNVEEIKYLVKNHMKVKPSTWDSMRDIKKEPIQSHPAFDKLMGFTSKLDGGGINLEKNI